MRNKWKYTDKIRMPGSIEDDYSYEDIGKSKIKGINLIWDNVSTTCIFGIQMPMDALMKTLDVH